MTTTTHRMRPAIGALYAGLALTVVALLVPYTGSALADHIKSGYPGYPRERVDSAVTAGLAVLTVLGVLGILCWLGTIWAVKADKWWARLVATTIFVLGTGTALATLLVKDTSGATGFPPLVGWAQLLPCLAGLLAVALLWRRA